MAVNFLFFIPIILISFAQDTASLYKLYAERKMEALKSQLPLLKESPEKTFFQTLFISNADSSVELYKLIYKNASGKLKPLVSRKLYEYYYAKGFYVTAQRYEDSEGESVYEIQLGAFLSQENALDLKEKLFNGGLKTYLVIKEINQKKFYCIRMKGKDSIESTTSLADQIGRKFNLKYRIIK
jgi:hypothetical protein